MLQNGCFSTCKIRKRQRQNPSVLRRRIRLLVPDSDVQCFFRTGADAVAAADTLHAVRLFAGIDIHLAGLCAGTAVNTRTLIEAHADEGETVEESIECSQRAEVFAERAVHDEPRYDDDAEYDKFPVKEPSELRTDDRIRGVCDAAGDRAGRADVLTECRRQRHRERQQDHQDQKHCVLQIAQVLIQFKLILLIERNKIQKILDKAEGAKEATYDTAAKSADKDQDTQDVVRETERQAA